MTLDEIRKLCDEAMPGPWEWAFRQLCSRTVDPDGITGEGVVMNASGLNTGSEEDHRFIAAARALLPALLEVAEKARNPSLEPRDYPAEEESAAWEALRRALAALDALKLP